MNKKSPDPKWYGVWAEITPLNSDRDENGWFWLRVTIEIPLANVFSSKIVNANANINQILDERVAHIEGKLSMQKGNWFG